MAEALILWAVQVDMAKRTGRVGSGRVAGQNGSFLNGSIRSQVESGRVDPYF